MLAEGDSLFVAAKNVLYVLRGDSLSVERRLPESYNITVLFRLNDGRLIAGTERSGLIGLDSERTVSLVGMPSAIAALYQGKDGLLWIGLREGGLIGIDLEDFRTVSSYSNVEGVPINNLRSIAADSKGNIYLGAVNGLFVISEDGSVHEELLDGVAGRPVCSVFVDRDDNLWVGTYYSGAFYFDTNSFPFINIDLPENVSTIRAIVQDRSGTLWMCTDNFGLWYTKDIRGKWFKLPGTDNLKYQCAFYDEITDAIWCGVYTGPVLRYDCRTGKSTAIPYVDTDDFSSIGQTIRICRYGDDLYLGGTNGVHIFNPKREIRITRKLPGFDSRVSDLLFDSSGILWIASQGLYYYAPGDWTVRVVPEPEGTDISWSSTLISDLSLDEYDRLYVSLVGSENGLLRYDRKEVESYNIANSGLADNHIAYSLPIDVNKVLVGTVAGLSILDTREHHCHNYGYESGLYLNSARGGAALMLEDGSLLAGGGDGLVRLIPEKLNWKDSELQINVDAIYINGERVDKGIRAPFLQHIELAPEQKNFSFEMAAFDYPSVSATTYYYKLDGYDKSWREFDISSQVSYMNMRHGRYVFRVRAQRGGGTEAESILRVRLMPTWYQTFVARVFFILLTLAVIFIIFYGLWQRMMLSEKLAMKERENVERTRFFVDISYRLRTPLTLIIGQIERFFRNFGSRTPGVEDIEDVYNKAKQMRSLISEFVDEQNDALIERTDDESIAIAVKHAKFLNAVIGAVERNLYSSDLDISVLCSELNMGKTTLTARLKEACGKTPHEFIEDIRLKHAASMLADGTYRVAEVSDKLGYTSPSSFTVRFKKKYGCAPSDYRAS
jgi:AraC-like DNA-binding protein/ligand-binding sensor domain-containing protein